DVREGQARKPRFEKTIDPHIVLVRRHCDRLDFCRKLRRFGFWVGRLCCGRRPPLPVALIPRLVAPFGKTPRPAASTLIRRTLGFWALAVAAISARLPASIGGG